MDLVHARRRACDMLGRIRAGENPADDIKREKEAPTFRAFAGQYLGGIVKLIECRLFSAFLHEAKLLNLRGGAIDNLPRFRSESG